MIEATIESTPKTNLNLKTLSIMRVFFKSIIGPKIKKPRIDGVGKRLLKEAPINASASEHSDKTYAKPIMTSNDETGPLPASKRDLAGTHD
jgi:hypothetical protein